MTDSTQMSNSTPKTVRLLVDSPSTEDLFEGHAHQKIATAISELVRNEVGGRVIGLEGTWGSGKSTVVALLAEQLIDPDLEPGDGQSDEASTASPRMLVFDAWAHQGDPLRKSFLLNLIAQVSEWGWLDSDSARDHREQLTGSRVHQVTTSTARLTPEGRVTSGALVLVPLGAAIFGMHKLWGILLMLAPLIAVSLFWSAVRLSKGSLKRRKKEGKKPWRWVAKISKSPEFSFFSQSQVTDSSADSIEVGEPTSVEFEEKFGVILEESLIDDRRLILVLDNLDRIAQDDARAILATMQTFTGSSERTRAKPWTSKVWTIIPFDGAGLARLWSESSPESESDKSLPTGSLGRAFFDKLFAVRFVVPPPVLSDWRTYFLDLLRESNPECSDADLKAVVRLRALYPSIHAKGRVARETITPRQLKQLCNQVSAIRMQRDDVPMTHVAYYVLLERDGKDILEWLCGDEGVPSAIAAQLGADLTTNITALFFGVEARLGKQLLLRDPIESALVAGDSDRISRLCEDSGFIETLDSIDLTKFAGEGATELSSAAFALDGASLLANKDLADFVNQNLKPIAKGVDSWNVLDRVTGAGLAAICCLFDQGDAEALLKRLRKMPTEGGEESVAALTGIAALADALEQKGLAPADILEVQCDYPVELLVQSIAMFAGLTKSEQSLSVLKFKTSPQDLAKGVVALAQSDPNAAMVAYTAIRKLPDRVDESQIASSIAEILTTTDPSDPSLTSLLQMLDLSRHVDAGKEVVKALADDGTLLHVVSRASANGWADGTMTALMLVLQLRSQPISTDPPMTREAVQGIGVLRQFVGNPAGFDQLVQAQLKWFTRHSRLAAFVLSNMKSKPELVPWGTYFLPGIIEHEGSTLAPETFRTNWEQLDLVLGSEAFDVLALSMMSTSDKRDKLLAGDRDPKLAIRLLTAASGSEDESMRLAVVNWACELIKAGTKDEWLGDLKASVSGPLVQLVTAISAGRKDAPASTDLGNALHDYAQSLEAGESVGQVESTALNELSKLLAPASRKALASELGAGLEGLDGNFDPRFLAVFGDFLEEEESFRRHPKLPIVLARLVSNESWDRLRWFVEMAKRHPDTLDEKTLGDGLDDLKIKVGERLRADSEVAPELAELAKLLRVSAKGS